VEHNRWSISNLDSGASTILARVNKSAGVQRTKTQTLGATLVATCAGNIAPLGDSDLSWIDLGQVDVNNIQQIQNQQGDSAGVIDYTTRFTLDDGQRPNHYTNSRLILKGDQSAPTGTVFVKFDHLTHGAVGDFFGVGSYTGQVPYNQIPSVRMNDGSIVELRDVLDFRPTLDSDNTGTLARLNELPAPSDLIQADITYYQGRRDKLVIYPPRGQRLRSELEIIKGVPAEES
jgi:hypothetical protein